MSVGESFRQGREAARAKRGQIPRSDGNSAALRGTIPAIEPEEFDPPPPPPPMPRRTAGSCRVHGRRYEGCPLDTIESCGSGPTFWEIVGWIVALVFLSSLFGS